eukprot:22354_5
MGLVKGCFAQNPSSLAMPSTFLPIDSCSLPSEPSTTLPVVKSEHLPLEKHLKFQVFARVSTISGLMPCGALRQPGFWGKPVEPSMLFLSEMSAYCSASVATSCLV